MENLHVENSYGHSFIFLAVKYNAGLPYVSQMTAITIHEFKYFDRFKGFNQFEIV